MIKRNELKAYFGGIVASHPDEVARQNDMFFINKTEKGNKVSGAKEKKTTWKETWKRRRRGGFSPRAKV